MKTVVVLMKSALVVESFLIDMQDINERDTVCPMHDGFDLYIFLKSDFLQF